MTKTIESLFILIGTLSDLLPLLLICGFLKICSKELVLKVLAISSIVFFLLNSSHYFLDSQTREFIYPFFTVCEFTFFAFFLHAQLKSKRVKTLIFLATILFILFAFAEVFIIRLSGLDSVLIGVESIIIIVFSFYYLYEQMNDVSEQFIYNKYHFWITVGLMIYLGGSFFIYLFANQVDKQVLQQWWVITVFLYMVKNIFYLIGISIYIKQNRNKPKTKHTYYPSLN
jgi:hypothetical protein